MAVLYIQLPYYSLYQQFMCLLQLLELGPRYSGGIELLLAKNSAKSLKVKITTLLVQTILHGSIPAS